MFSFQVKHTFTRSCSQSNMYSKKNWTMCKTPWVDYHFSWLYAVWTKHQAGSCLDVVTVTKIRMHHHHQTEEDRGAGRGEGVRTREWDGIPHTRNTPQVSTWMFQRDVGRWKAPDWKAVRADVEESSLMYEDEQLWTLVCYLRDTFL